MIDVIIPAYNAHKTIEKTLMSIAIQKNKNDINVYIIDDNSFYDYLSIVDNFSDELNIKTLSLNKNNGPGAARQYGIDHSKGKYITFIDADDLFIHSDSILKMYNEMEKGNDYVYGITYYEELNVDIFSDSEVHAKMYRREFLEKNHVKFNNTFYHEDNAFNSLVIVNDPKTAIINEVLYFYSKNEDSLSRADGNDAAFIRLEVYIDNINYVVEKAKQNNCSELLITQYIYRKYSFLVDIYNSLDYQKLVIIKKWLEKYDFSHYIEQLSSEEQNRIYLFT